MTMTPTDRLEVLVLVDNVTDSLSSTPPFVTREWTRLQQKGMRWMTGGALCCANHGLSLVITAHGPNGPRTNGRGLRGQIRARPYGRAADIGR